MTPKEKAKELVHKYDLMQTYIYGFSLNDAKQCALIAVDDILEILYSLKLGNALSEEIEYYEQVKQEIINL